MTGSSEWQGRVGRAWADEWRRTDRSFAGLTGQLLAAIATQPGTRVLDIGCGAGEISLGVARARGDARVTGIDISADLVAAASQRAAEFGAQRVRFAHADAGTFHDPAGPADLLISRHGVMFFADPPGVFGHLARHAAPDARMVFSCFRARHENLWADLFDRCRPARRLTKARFRQDRLPLPIPTMCGAAWPGGPICRLRRLISAMLRAAGMMPWPMRWHFLRESGRLLRGLPR